MWANNETGVAFSGGKNRGDRAAETASCFTPMRSRPWEKFRSASRIRRSIPFRCPRTNCMARKASERFTSGNARRFQPALIGGSQENNRRAGTENVASIVALGKAAECAAAAMEDEATRVRAMRDRFEAGLTKEMPARVSMATGTRACQTPRTSVCRDRIGRGAGDAGSASHLLLGGLGLPHRIALGFARFARNGDEQRSGAIQSAFFFRPLQF